MIVTGTLFMDSKKLKKKVRNSKKVLDAAEECDNNKLQYSFEEGYYADEKTIDGKSGWKVLSRNDMPRHIVIEKFK